MTNSTVKSTTLAVLLSLVSVLASDSLISVNYCYENDVCGMIWSHGGCGNFGCRVCNANGSSCDSCCNQCQRLGRPDGTFTCAPEQLETKAKMLSKASPIDKLSKQSAQISLLSSAAMRASPLSLPLFFLLLLILFNSCTSFGPPLNADPGAGSPFAVPLSEFDNQAGVECPNPPCRQLKKDLEERRDHNDKLKANKRSKTGKHDMEDDQIQYPFKLNVIIGGKDCKVCNDVLMGENLNPNDLSKMRAKVQFWEGRTNKRIEGKPNDVELKKHAITVTQCIHAFDGSTCIVDLEKTDEVDRMLRGK